VEDLEVNSLPFALLALLAALPHARDPCPLERAARDPPPDFFWNALARFSLGDIYFLRQKLKVTFFAKPSFFQQPSRSQPQLPSFLSSTREVT
jgi:hypothetical protein